MRKFILTLSLLISIINNDSYSQNVLNGDFEINTLSSCSINNPNNSFNLIMSDCFAFGNASQIDIQDSLCGYSAPASGNWFISLASSLPWLTDWLSLKLSSMIVSGNSYQLSFYHKANNILTVGQLDSLEIGISSDTIGFGTKIYSVQPQPISNWTLTTFTFTAPITGQFITVGNKGYHAGWNFIDDIKLTNTSGVVENYHNQSVNIYPNPFNIETNLISTIAFKEAVLTLYNSLGNEIKKIKNISGASFSLQRDNLPSGLYYLQIKQDNIILTSNKLIINDK